MIGVDVTTTSLPTTGAGDTTDAATHFFPFLASRGPVEPTVIRSYGQFLDVYGPRVTYGWGHDEALTSFSEANGRGRVIALRVVGPGATTGTLTLKDRSSGSGLDTLRLDASSPGAWATDVAVTVVDGIGANTMTVTVYYAGQPQEQYTEIDSVDALVNALRDSAYLRGTNLGSASTGVTALPRLSAVADNVPVPAALGGTPTDDRANVSASTMTAALAKFTEDYGPGIVTIPGQPHSTTATALGAHCAATNRVAAVYPPLGTAPATAAAAARALRANTNAKYLQFVYPWVEIPDGAGGTRQIPPSGFAAGLRARQIGTTGPWDAAAGRNGVARFVTGVERALTRNDINTLALDAVNSIRLAPAGPMLYGARSLSADETNWRWIKYADTMNDISWSLQRDLDQEVFTTVDSEGVAYQKMTLICEAILGPIKQAGGIYALKDDAGQERDKGYDITIDDRAINPLSSVEQGVTNIYIAVRLSPLAETINVTVAKVTLATAL